jgi:hypothetical protein
VVGTGNSLMITQSGNENLVVGSQAGASNAISVTQSGDYNVATVIQN